MREILLPEGWPRPKGYSNGIMATGRMVFTAGLVGWNEEEKFEHEDLVGQFRQILESTKAVLAEAGAEPEHIVRMTWYITDKAEYLANLSEIGAAWRDVMGRVFPCMACVQVAALIEDAAKIEIETTAVIPD
ncbi:RidA family protein [Emcibacter nanhaiensis]|uniref:RidA family protein n=1 Tax=Emcibacter nanhaiensis TaxID=1505037 RepID=A0A501PGB3_9PROT|nr:RidA family protein [Emcibacter nanhaiensis]TPD59097.1 RidA family protein [Emcibacter nanhaiensis]